MQFAVKDGVRRAIIPGTLAPSGLKAAGWVLDQDGDGAVDSAAASPQPSFALVGDSISNNSGSLDTGATGSQLIYGKGWAFVANALIGRRYQPVYPGPADPGYFGTTNPDASGGTSTGTAFGCGGARTTTLLNYGYVAAAAASQARVVIVHVGTNDVNDGTSAATIAANILTIWRLLTAAGKIVVATTILPRDSTIVTGAKLTALNAANVLIRQNAAVEPGVYLCDWHAAMLDSAGAAPSGSSASAYFVDGAHPNPSGAGRMATVLAPILASICPVTAPADHLMINPADVLTPNPIGVGNSSGVATSWTVTTIGSPTTITKTKVARTDVFPGEWQQVLCAAATVATDGWNITITDSTTADWTTGDVVYASAEVQADAAGWDCRGMYLDCVLSGATQVASVPNVSTNERTAMTTVVMPAPTGNVVFVTPRITVPAGVTAIRAVFRFYGSGTVRVSRIGVRKL